MKLIFMKNLFVNIATAVYDGDTYYVTLEEVSKFKTILVIFSVLAIISAVTVTALAVMLVIRYYKKKRNQKDGESE